MALQAQWKLGKTKLRKSLQGSWDVMMEDEGLSSILQQVDVHGDVEHLIEEAKAEVDGSKWKIIMKMENKWKIFIIFH